MKRILNLLIILTITLYSCSDKYQPIGQWEDNIKLSTKSAEFSAAGDSITIKTGGSWWWIDGVSVDTLNFYGLRGDLQEVNYTIKQNCFLVERRDKNTLFIKVDENPNNFKRIITVDLEAGDYFDMVRITQKSK